ncbi:MAG: NAD(P)-dependent oxidoreductase [Magnetococcus sp. WYHC-3]
MDILLTGATGFLGSHLLRSFVAAGHCVTALKRPGSNLARVADSAPACQWWELHQGWNSADFAALGPWDVIVHTATCYARNGESVEDVVRSNTLFPLELLSRAGRGTRFINVDTVLPDQMNPYALSKAQFRQWGAHLARANSFTFINVPMEHIYGPGDDASKFTTFIIRRCLSGAAAIDLTPGEQKRDFLFIDDAVSAFMRLLDKTGTESGGPFQEFPLGSGESVTIRHYVETVRRLTGSSIALNFGAISYRDNEVMDSQTRPHALESLGWRCRHSLEEGLNKTILQEKSL